MITDDQTDNKYTYEDVQYLDENQQILNEFDKEKCFCIRIGKIRSLSEDQPISCMLDFTLDLHGHIWKQFKNSEYAFTTENA